MNREFLTVGHYIPVQEVSPRLSADQAAVLANFSDLFQRRQDDPKGLDLHNRLNYLYHPRYPLPKDSSLHPLLPIFDSFYMVVASIAKGSLGPATPSPEAEVIKGEILAGLTEVMRVINDSGSGDVPWPKPIYHHPSSRPSWWEGSWRSIIRGENSQWVVSYTPLKRRLNFNWYQHNFFRLVDLPAPYYLTASFWDRIYSLGNIGIIQNGFQVERKGWEKGPKGFLRPSREAGRNLLDDYIGPKHIMEIATGSIEDCLALQRALIRRLNVGFLEATMPSPERIKTIS